MTGTVPVTVVVPTIGRPALLERCLESLAQCEPRAAEILVMDQSEDARVAQTVAAHARCGARLVPCDRRGTARARNHGLREARNELVLFTDDDCTVASSWVGAARAASADSDGRPRGMVTGQVLPGGDPARVPSTKADSEPHDFTGGRDVGALFSGNMAVSRLEALALGGFDERFGSVAEDVDFCYRWLRAGRRLLYRPELVVWHHDWRTDAQLEKLYRGYWRGMGVFYAKHLHHPDAVVLRLLALSLFRIVRATVRRFVKESSQARSSPPGLAREFGAGLLGSWRTFGRDGAEAPSG